MEGSLEKFNLCCLFCNIKFKTKNRYIKSIWRFVTSYEITLKFQNRSIVEKDFLVAVAQTPNCLDTDLFPADIRVFGKKILETLKMNENNYKLEYYVQSDSFKHTVMYVKVPVENAVDVRPLEYVDMSCPTNKKPPHTISSHELNEYKAAFMSHIVRVTNRNDTTQEDSLDAVAVSNPNTDNLEHNRDDGAAATRSSDDMWQDYMSDNAGGSPPINVNSQENNDDDVIVVSSDDMWQDYMSDNAGGSPPINVNSQENNDDDVIVVSSDDMWQDYMSDNAEESVANNDGPQEDDAELLSDNAQANVSDNVMSVDSAELVSNVAGNGGNVEGDAQRTESEKFLALICDIPNDALCNLYCTIRKFFRRIKLQEKFSGLSWSQQNFLVAVVEKPHLLTQGEGLPENLREIGREVLAIVEKNRMAYRWDSLAYGDTVVYKKIPLVNRNVANASPCPQERIELDVKLTMMPHSGDCVMIDPENVLDPGLGVEWPIFSSILANVNDDAKVLSFLTVLRDFLDSDNRQVIIKPCSYALTELIFKISARVQYLDTEIFSGDCRSVGVEVLTLLREKSMEFCVTCLVKGPHMSEIVTFKKMRSNIARKLKKEYRQIKKAELERNRVMDVETARTASASYPAPIFKDTLVEGLNTPFASPLTQRMMANMGWKGGALGKNGEGISTPIMPNLNQIKHAGLGYVSSMKGKRVEEPASKDQQHHMIVRLLGVMYAFLDDDAVDMTYVDVADLGSFRCEGFPKSAANMIDCVNRHEMMCNIGAVQEEMLELVLDLMMRDQNLVLRHSVETATRINIFKVSLSKYKKDMRGQIGLDEETERTKPHLYREALLNSLKRPIKTLTDPPENIGEINNNNLLQSITDRNYGEIFMNPKVLLKEPAPIEDSDENDARGWYADDKSWNDQSVLNSNELVERLAVDLLKSRQRIFDNSDEALDDKNRVLGLVADTEPNVVLDADMASVIQKKLLKELDKLPHKTAIKLKCFGIRNNMLIYQALNDYSYDWLVEAVKEIEVKIYDFNVEENRYRGLLVSSNYAIKNDVELIGRIGEYNENIDTSVWSVLNRFRVGDQMSYEVVVDRKSLVYIFSNNCSLNLGIDQAEFVFVGTL